MLPAISRCIDSSDVQRFVEHFARKLSWRLPRTFDRDDSRQELWLAVVRRVSSEEDGPDVIQKATAAVMSRYGNLIRGRAGTCQVRVVSYPDTFDISCEDTSFHLVEANETIDSIHSRLQGKKSLTRAFELYRFGKTSSEIARELGVSSSRVRRMKQEIIAIANA